MRVKRARRMLRQLLKSSQGVRNTRTAFSTRNVTLVSLLKSSELSPAGYTGKSLEDQRASTRAKATICIVVLRVMTTSFATSIPHEDRRFPDNTKPLESDFSFIGLSLFHYFFDPRPSFRVRPSSRVPSVTRPIRPPTPPPLPNLVQAVRESRERANIYRDLQSQ